MISFIVIGKNEGWRLRKCLISIFNVIQSDNINEYEIIYVDSKSSDNSLEIAKSFSNVKIYLLTEDCNAAIARNVGAKQSIGNILFFIDGDMEVQPHFIPTITNGNELIYPFISAIYKDIIYNNNWEYEYSSCRFNLKDNNYELSNITGGLFLIEHKLWDKIGGMDNNLVRSQDYDLGLRLSKQKIPQRRYNFVLAFHNTIDYSNRKDSFKYNRYTAMLLRKHRKNKSYLKTFVSSNYSTVLLIFIIPLIFLSPYWILPYLMCILFRLYKLVHRLHSFKFVYLIYYPIRDVTIIYYLLFIKKRKINIKYNIIT